MKTPLESREQSTASVPLAELGYTFHPSAWGKGYATELLKYVAVQAAANGLPRVHLDSRASALGFYDKLKFTMLTSVPCWIEAEALRRVE